MKKLSGAILRLTEDEPLLHTAKLFRVALFGWVLLCLLCLLPHHRAVWGTDGLAPPRPFPSDIWSAWITHVLLHPRVAPHYALFLIGDIAALALGIFGVAPRVTALVVWFTTINIHHRASSITDGGDNLAWLLLFYLLFVNTSGKPTGLRRSPLARNLVVAASNAGIFLCRWQVAVVYFTASLLKLQGELWQNGMALYYILQNETFSHPVFGRFVVDHVWLAVAGTYATVAFQLAFPWLVWFRRVRPYLLVAGVLLHLGILFVMGLFTFGLIMCISYVVWFPDAWSARVLGRRSDAIGPAGEEARGATPGM
ncbi:MAG: HTTM domain-containing protein [Minicystis sp.]